MPIQKGTFKHLPPKEEIIKAIEEEKNHLNDLAAFMLYIIPVAKRFGDKVFSVAAKSLSENGIDVDKCDLKNLAVELETSDGQKKYADQIKYHMTHRVTG